MVASSSKVARLEAMVTRCVAVAKRLGEELETKDATIRHLQVLPHQCSVDPLLFWIRIRGT